MNPPRSHDQGRRRSLGSSSSPVFSGASAVEALVQDSLRWIKFYHCFLFYFIYLFFFYMHIFQSSLITPYVYIPYDYALC
jgi:hypothetical protein